MRWFLLMILVVVLLFFCSCTTHRVSRLSREKFKPRIYSSVHTQKFWQTENGDWGVGMFSDTTKVFASTPLWIIKYQGIDTPYPITAVKNDRIFIGEWGRITLNENKRFIMVELKSNGTHYVERFIEQIQ
jgi:hypothetical protein